MNMITTFTVFAGTFAVLASPLPSQAQSFDAGALRRIQTEERTLPERENSNRDANQRSAAADERVEAAIQRVNTFIQQNLLLITKVNNRVTASAVLSEESRGRILADLSADRAFLEAQRSAALAATSLEEVRTVAQGVKNHIRERRARVQQQRQEYRTTFDQRIASVQEKTRVILERLEKVKTVLDGIGVDTSAFQSLLDEYGSTIDSLSRVDADSPAQIRETMGFLRSQIQNLKIEVRRLADAAKEPAAVQ